MLPKYLANIGYLDNSELSGLPFSRLLVLLGCCFRRPCWAVACRPLRSASLAPKSSARRGGPVVCDPPWTQHPGPLGLAHSRPARLPCLSTRSQPPILTREMFFDPDNPKPDNLTESPTVCAWGVKVLANIVVYGVSQVCEKNSKTSQGLSILVVSQVGRFWLCPKVVDFWL